MEDTGLLDPRIFDATVGHRLALLRYETGLTDSEVDILRLIAEGYSNREIARQEHWSEVTIKRKVADIFRNRVVKRNKGAEVWGWGTAYGSAQAGQKPQLRGSKNDQTYPCSFDSDQRNGFECLRRKSPNARYQKRRHRL